MTKKTRLVFFLIGLTIFIYLIFEFGLEDIVINIEKIGWWFIPIVAVWGIVYIFNSIAWYIILNGKKNSLRFADILSVSISGFAINYITPFINLGGEPYRVMAIKDSVGIHNSVSSVILYRMVHILGSFFFWFTGIIIVAFLVTLSPEFRIVLFIVSAVLIALILFFFSRH
ncbi:MAG: lysylphosphatidylglycerol synthase domain-containing protein, partial [Ignavibacteriaceae bacterium]